MRNNLNQDFTKEEVYCALKSMKASAAPGPDGIPALFYQKFWSIVGDDVSNLVLDILNGNGDPGIINHTYICLIPKLKSQGQQVILDQFFIDIWQDNWLPHQNGYKVWTPKPDNLDISLVPELISQYGCWNSGLINSIFFPFEATQILQIPLPINAQNDHLSWGPDKRG